jgi:type II secretory pathway pseudopilin PulG
MSQLTKNETKRRISVTELLIVAAMVAAVGGFAMMSLVRGSRNTERSASALELANHIQKARLDSMRRGTTDLSQMAQIKIFNRRSYSISFDGDGDGNLDIPLVKSLPEAAGTEIEGPFPKTYLFDSRGVTVDADGKPLAPQPIFVKNNSGRSAIKFDADGKVVLMPSATRSVAAR